MKRCEPSNVLATPLDRSDKSEFNNQKIIIFNMIAPPRSVHILLFASVTLSTLQSCSARPQTLQEQNLGYYKSLFQGAHVGFETLLALMGYYEEDEVKEGMSSDTLIINPVNEEDQTEIKLVGLGLGRTGTTSVVTALEILGYSVVHDDEQTELTDLYAAEDRGDIDMDNFHDILGLRGYNATFKTANYEWVAENPEVKAILTVRDNPNKYVDSWLVAAPFMEILKMPPFRWMKTVNELLPSLEEEYKMETTGGNPENYLDRETLRQNYVQYVQTVQESIPSESLLTFNVKQGWGPLCEFLGHPVPEGIPFPHVHTRAKLQGEMYFLRVITWIWPLAIIVPLILIVIVIVMVLKRTKLKSIFSKKP